MRKKKQKIVIIAGPTASGKSSVAIELAHRFDAEIVNIDSMQVYRDMDIGTAKLPLEERKGIPHHLIDVVEPDEEFNAAVYRDMAVPVIEDVISRGRACFVVGGTGLYIKTLLGGLLFCPPVSTSQREELRKDCDQLGPEFLHERLEGVDPETARRIHPRDRTRIIRALEIITLTGEPLSALIHRHGFQERRFETLKFCLQMNREALYDRINGRSVTMMERGLIHETESLLHRGYSDHLKPMKSIGYRHAVAYLKGKWTMDETLRQLQKDTRSYAKRQITWFRSDPEMIWLAPERKEEIAGNIDRFLKTPETESIVP